MSPRAAKLHVVTCRNDHIYHWVIPDSDWEKIEAAYGRQLSPTVRAEILVSMRVYCKLALDEMEAPSALPARRRIDRLRKLARPLLAEIENRNSLSRMAPEAIADGPIYRPLEHSNLERRLLKPLSRMLQRFIAATDAAHRGLPIRNPKPGGPTYWDLWIVTLTDIAIKNQLPAGAGEIAGKPESYSPFVNLVDALQKLIPSHLRRSTHSQCGLNESIKRARRGADMRGSKPKSRTA